MHNALKPDHRWAVVLVFCLYLFLGLSISKDYGIGFDEAAMRHIGLVSAKYLLTLFSPNTVRSHPFFASMPALDEYRDSDYGVAFEVPLVAIENLALGDHGDPYQIYMLRHRCNFIAFFIGVIFFYRLVSLRFGSWKMGLCGCVFLVASPRIFADSFYNSKDIPLLSAFIASAYFLNRYLDSKTAARAAAFGISTGLTLALRVVGIILPVVTGACLFWELAWHLSERRDQKQAIGSFGVYLACASVTGVIFWPYLWSNPAANFVEAFQRMSAFRWDHYVLYLGRYIRSTELPWHYIPVWIGITTPLLYLALFGVGVSVVLRTVIHRGWMLYASPGERQDLLALMLCLGPILAVILLNSVLYDGWRHLFFVYGFLIFTALSGLHSVWTWTQIPDRKTTTRKAVRAVIAALVVLSVGSTLFFMIRYHPYQNVYFNALVGGDAGSNFELDYWGLSYRQGLAYIAQHDPRSVIRVLANNTSCYRNRFTLAPADRDRIVFVDDLPDYYITEFRHFSNDPIPVYKANDEVFNITVNRTKILAVYQGGKYTMAQPFITAAKPWHEQFHLPPQETGSGMGGVTCIYE